MGVEFLRGFGLLLIYFVICASAAIILRSLVQVPREVFRKILHFILLGSVFFWVYGFTTWWLSALAAIVFVLIVYPILALAERIPGYSELLIERKGGEIKRSLVVVFGMFTIVISLCWGLLGERYLVIASVLAWGIGDAAAALVGKRFGKHFLEGRMIEGRKSLEGTLAMFAFSFLAVVTVLFLEGAVIWYAYLPIGVITAGVCALVELFTKNGMDTLTCPIAAAAVLIPQISFWGV